MPSGPASPRPALALSQKPASFWFHPSSGAGPGHTHLSGYRYPGRGDACESSSPAPASTKSQVPNRGALRTRVRARWASHSKRLSFSLRTLSAAGRGVFTAPRTAGRAPPRGERVAARLTYSGRLERAPHAAAATSTIKTTYYSPHSRSSPRRRRPLLLIWPSGTVAAPAAAPQLSP